MEPAKKQMKVELESKSSKGVSKDESQVGLLVWDDYYACFDCTEMRCALVTRKFFDIIHNVTYHGFEVEYDPCPFKGEFHDITQTEIDTLKKFGFVPHGLYQLESLVENNDDKPWYEAAMLELKKVEALN